METKRMLELVKQHEVAEVAGDLDAIMATLCSHPVYDIYSLNLHLEGTEAVRQMYAEACANGFPEFDHLATWTSDLGVAREDLLHMKVPESDELLDVRVISIFGIDEEEGLLTGERVIMTDNPMLSSLGGTLGIDAGAAGR